MKSVWVQIIVAALIVFGIGLSVANSLETFEEYDVSGGALGLFDLVPPLPLLFCAALIALITAGNLGARYFKWMVLLRAGHIMAPSRKLFFSFLASFIGNLTPFYILYVLRIAPLRERFMAALVLLAVDLATDVIAIALLGAAASYPLLAGASVVFLLGACALAIFPTKSKDRSVGIASLFTSLIFAQSFSILIWSVTGLSLWLALLLFDVRLGMPEAIQIYAASHAEGIVSITLPGFLRVGRSMIAMLIDLGVSTETAVFTAALVRVLTYWLVILAALLSLLQIRRQWRRVDPPENHFDEIASGYKQTIPEHIRVRLLNRKIELNRKYLPVDRYRRGIDAGCGQGWYIKEMLARDYEMQGIDFSGQQIQQARLHLGESDSGLVRQGSITSLPFADESCDFVYTINTIHHLPDVESQFQAFREVRRVLRPGGRFLVHEMNVKNPLFRFYMSYIFPLIKDIDDGTEVWLKETTGPFADGWNLIETEYRTFLPDFIPEFVYRRLWGVEKFLETNSYTARFSAHVMFVLEKPERPYQAD